MAMEILKKLLNNKIFFILVLILTVFLAGAYYQKKTTKPQYITVTKEVIKPEKVIEVRTVVKEVVAQPVVRPNNVSVSDILCKLEQSKPELKINPFKIIEDKSGGLSVEKDVKATLGLDYLKYDLTLQPEVEIIKYPGRKKFKFGQFVYIQKDKAKADMQIIYAPIKLGCTELNLGAGFYGATITISKQLHSNIDIHAGYARKYDGDNAFVTGLSFKF